MFVERMAISMRLLTIILILFLTPLAAEAQALTFAREGVKYELELPSARWQAVPRLDVHEHFDFVYSGDHADAYLRVREYLVKDGTTSEDLLRREQSRTLKFLPGYIECAACEGERFDGTLSGTVFSYEYTSGGSLMAGRVYYLKVNARTFYSLHFTGARSNLGSLGDQMDSIARSFRVK